jgi:hypothetical protein
LEALNSEINFVRFSNEFRRQVEEKGAQLEISVKKGVKSSLDDSFISFFLLDEWMIPSLSISSNSLVLSGLFKVQYGKAGTWPFYYFQHSFLSFKLKERHLK